MTQTPTKKVMLLDGASLSIATGQTMLLEPFGLAKPFKAQFVGMEAKRYILAKVPYQHFAGVNVAEEEGVTVKLLNPKGSILGFQSCIRERLKRPTTLFVLDFPLQVEVLSLRRHDRVFCYLPANALFAGNDLCGTIVDISSGGCKFVPQGGASGNGDGLGDGVGDGDGAEGGGDDHQVAGDGAAVCAIPPLNKGQEVYCSFTMAGAEEPLHLAGLVMNRFEDQGKLSYGIAFKEMSQEVKTYIERYVENVQDALSS